MRPIIVALVLLAAGSVASAQTAPSPGNPPSGWSGGATPPHSDSGKTEPDAKGPAGTPPAASAPPSAGDIKTTKIASEREARRAIESEGFTRVSALKKDADGAWSGRAMRGTANVAVRVDARGNVSVE